MVPPGLPHGNFSCRVVYTFPNVRIMDRRSSPTPSSRFRWCSGSASSGCYTVLSELPSGCRMTSRTTTVEACENRSAFPIGHKTGCCPEIQHDGDRTAVDDSRSVVGQTPDSNGVGNHRRGDGQRNPDANPSAVRSLVVGLPGVVLSVSRLCRGIARTVRHATRMSFVAMR